MKLNFGMGRDDNVTDRYRFFGSLGCWFLNDDFADANVSHEERKVR